MIKVNKVSKIYKTGEIETYALDNINLEVKKGEMIAIMGPSGSGKSTLLNILGLVDYPTEGGYTFNDEDIIKLKGKRLAKFRGENIGFIFQYFALLNEYTVYDNVTLPLVYKKISYKQKKQLAKNILSQMGIYEHINKDVDQLSGGQQQRLAIARALIGGPSLILADEPTGALDQKTGMDIMDVLEDINRKGKTIIIVTHDINVAKRCERIINIVDGKII